ncbi:FAD/NAD-binding domain-containing protein [Mycena venus]|uniref:FAD/NAD-binding domain-containing protein n=1 Tax=Mycena venus TaxID=2733690 RepID=A0A8H6XN50_9AGAR|nr:FAD/NAD-binding domain-containing protein [Mycena venus]
MRTQSTDVLIIGAGPAGLMAALVLSMMKVKVRLVDRRLSHEASGQADGIQPRMIEIWESLGIGSELRERSEHVHRMVKKILFPALNGLILELKVTYSPTADRAGIEETQGSDVEHLSTNSEVSILARNDIIEEILEERLKVEGVVVERSGVPISLDVESQDQDPYPVKVKVAWLNEQIIREKNVSQEARGDLESVDGLVEKFECIPAKFVIGCDGGKSWTRRQLGIAMEGNQTDLDWGVVDFTPRTNFPTPRTKNIIQSPLEGFLGYLPRPNGAARVYVMLGEGKEEKVVSGDECKRIIAGKMRRGFAPYEMEIENATWCAIFRVSQRVAKRFSGHGRIFIAGDACHTHSPKAGQGANASMSDTFNLAWKIAYVVRHQARLDILETYEQERRPHSLELIQLDRKIFRLFSGQTIIPTDYTSLWHEQMLFVSGIGLRYSSQLIDSSGQFLAPGLTIGERIPSSEVIRTDDWRPLNLHDICPFDGRFRLFILPGSVLEECNVKRLAAFNSSIAAKGEQHEVLTERLETCIIDNDPSTVVESIPLLRVISGSNDRVYFDRNATSGGVYNIWQIASHGIAFMVRPDAHISSIVAMDEAGICAIKKYFTSWTDLS